MQIICTSAFINVFFYFRLGNYNIPSNINIRRMRTGSQLNRNKHICIMYIIVLQTILHEYQNKNHNILARKGAERVRVKGCLPTTSLILQNPPFQPLNHFFKKYIRSLPSNLCIPFSYPTQNKSLGVSLNKILNYHIIIFRYLKHDVFRWSSFNSYKSPPTKTVFHNSAPPTPIFYFFLCYVIFSTAPN